MLVRDQYVLDKPSATPALFLRKYGKDGHTMDQPVRLVQPGPGSRGLDDQRGRLCQWGHSRDDPDKQDEQRAAFI
jgi:hypothetical protein